MLDAFRDRGVVRTNILIFLASAAALVLLFGLIGIGIRHAYNDAYSMDYYALNTGDFPALLEDDYEAVHEEHGELDFIAFDENGATLFTTDETMAQSYKYEDAALINAYDDDTYWNIAEAQVDGGKHYYVTKYLINYDNSEDLYLGSVELDEDYKVVGGDLLQDREQLTWQQLEMMNGTYSTDALYKYEYKNSDGEARTVIYTEYARDYVYQEQTLKANRVSRFLYLLFFVLAAAVIILQAFWMRRVTQRYLQPLDEAITAYGKGVRANIQEKDLAIEFRPVAANFNKLMDRLDAANAEKDHVYEERQRVIADVSHDLRTPLTVIQGYSQAFLEERVPEDKKEQYMSVIHDKSVLSSDMINMLFDFTKMEHPDFTPDKRPVDLVEVTLDYLTGKREELVTAGDGLVFTLPDHSITYECDVRLLIRLYENLIGNAVKHNDAGTVIYFMMEERRFDIRVTIADNGKGIPEELKKTLFNPFVTGNTARPSGGGTGLGMTIAKRIVDLHGGSIRLLEPPEEGMTTEFEIIFHKS